MPEARRTLEVLPTGEEGLEIIFRPLVRIRPDV